MVRKKSPRQKNTFLFVQHCIVGEGGAGFYFAQTGLTKNGFLAFYSTCDFSGLAPRTHHGFRFPFFLLAPVQPKYSPDLNPLDYSLWSAIDDKALKQSKSGETADAYKKRLRRIALRMPKKVVRVAVEQIKKRAEAIFAADGDNILRD